MADEKQLIDIEALSHFKTKQDLQNLEKFMLKSDSTELKGAVRYDTAQMLTEEQKAQARANIGAAAPGEGGGGGGSVEGAVRYDVQQALDDVGKARARENIGTTDGTWANMPDKPFGESGLSVEMPSDVSSLTTISSQPLEALGGTAFSFVKVSDNYLATPEELHGALIKVLNDGRVLEFIVEESYTVDLGNGFGVLIMENGFYPLLMNVSSVGTSVLPSAAMTEEDLTFNVTETGLYFLCIEGMAHVQSLSKTEIKKIDAKYLPSYVDDVVEGALSNDIFYDTNQEEITPETGKIYVDLNTGYTYRWSGSIYIQLNPNEYTFATTSDIDALFT